MKFDIKLDSNTISAMTVDGYKALLSGMVEMPVFSIDEDIIVNKWSGEKIASNISQNLFPAIINGDIYRIHGFKFGEIVYNSLDVFVPDHRLDTYSIILSHSMLRNAAYSLNPGVSEFFTVETDELVRDCTVDVSKLHDTH